MARLHKRVAVVDGHPRGAWGAWRPRGAGHSPHPKSEAGVSGFPFFSLQPIHPGATRPSRNADLTLVPRPPIRTRGSTEAWLSLGSFLGRAQGSAIRAEDTARLPLLTLGSWEALLASGTWVTLRSSRSREACEAGPALGPWCACHCSVLLRHVDHGPWGSWGPRQAWLSHSILSWITSFSRAPFVSFGSRGSRYALSAREAREPIGSIGSSFSLGPRWPAGSRIPLESWRAGRSLWPIGAAGC